MTMTDSTQQGVAELLGAVMAVDFDAIEAYHAALERFDDTSYRTAMSMFRQDHERHVQELGLKLRDLGVDPPDGPDVKMILTKGKVVIAGLLGDRAILLAMRSNEDDTNSAYERAAARSDLSVDLADLFARGLSDERRHRGWCEQQLAELEALEAERTEGGERLEVPLQ